MKSWLTRERIKKFRGLQKKENKFWRNGKIFYLCSPKQNGALKSEAQTPDGARPEGNEKQKSQTESLSGRRQIIKPNRDGEAQKFFKEMSCSITSIEMTRFISSIVQFQYNNSITDSIER